MIRPDQRTHGATRAPSQPLISTPFPTADPMTDPETTINDAWERRDELSFETQGPVRDAVNEALDALDLSLIHI